MKLSQLVFCILLFLPSSILAAEPKSVADKITGDKASIEDLAQFALVLLVDKSGSMAKDGKIQSVRQTAVQAVQALADDDYFSLIAFDYVPFIVVDLQRVVQAKELVAKRVANLYPSGRTNLLPALSAAIRKLRKVHATKKHIIVISDPKLEGHAPQEYYQHEIKNMKKAGITISCFAIGEGSNFSLLKLLADSGQGLFHHVPKAVDLPQEVVNEIRKAGGKRAPKATQTQRTPIKTVPSGPHEISPSSPDEENRVLTSDKPPASSPEPPTDMSDIELFSPLKRYKTTAATKVFPAPSGSTSPIGEVDVNSVVEAKRRVGMWLELISVKGRAGYINLRDATAISTADNANK